jgi:diguanylate cyclase (GGDEF)-like protein/PAS domain S-box-containing protein
LNARELTSGTADRLMPSLKESRCRQALEAASIGTWWLDMQSGMVQCDPIAADIFGIDEEERPVLAFVHPDDRAAVANSLEICFLTGSLHDIEFRTHRPEGTTRWVRTIARPPEGGVDDGCLSGVVFEITRQKETEFALHESRRQLATLINNLPGVAYRCAASAPWPLHFISKAVADIVGYSSDEICSDMGEWSRVVHPADQARVAQEMEAAIVQRRPFSIRYRIVHRDGSIKWVHDRGEASYDAAGAPELIEGFLWDVTDQQAADEKLQWTASHDGLTGLPNRMMFQQRVDEALARPALGAGQLGILLIDLDDFKLTNDTLGHDAGDALLRSVAERLSLSIGPNDIVARLSGDEFAVLVDGAADRSAIQRTGTKIMAGFEEPFQHHGRLFESRASMGISLFAEPGTHRSELMKDADIALYAAKGEGGGRLKLFEPRMRIEMQTRSSMLSVARDALANDWVVPHYQPKVELRTGRIIGFEALLRWQHPTLGLQSPNTIAAAFQDLDLAASISDRMISLVIEDMGRWSKAGVEFGQIAVNAAAAEFRRGNFPETLLGRLGAANIAPSRIQIEVTETVFLGRGSEYVETALQLLAAAGISIALDDFGTGYASLSHLKQFPVDTVKIDQCFVRSLTENPEDAAIVRAVISLCKSLGIAIVAEGIETEPQVAFLRKHGCDLGQGFLFGAAVPSSNVPDLIAGFNSKNTTQRSA